MAEGQSEEEHDHARKGRNDIASSESSILLPTILLLKLSSPLIIPPMYTLKILSRQYVSQLSFSSRSVDPQVYVQY